MTAKYYSGFFLLFFRTLSFLCETLLHSNILDFKLFQGKYLWLDIPFLCVLVSASILHKMRVFKKSGCRMNVWLIPLCSALLFSCWHSLPKPQRQLSAAPIIRNCQFFSAKSCQKLGPVCLGRPESQLGGELGAEEVGRAAGWDESLRSLFSPPSSTLLGPTVNFKYHHHAPLYYFKTGPPILQV